MPEVYDIETTSYTYGLDTASTVLQMAIDGAALQAAMAAYYPNKTRKEIDVPAKTPKEGFKFGCDPELFIFDKDDNPVPAFGLIPGDKKNPYPVTDGAWQVDGMAAEFNIDPCENFKDFNGKIEHVLAQGRKFLPEGHTFKAQPYVRWAQDVFDAQPDCAKELGCSPDYNAWTGACNTPPDRPEEDSTLSVAAGHLHIGWTDDVDPTDLQHILNCRDLVKQLDWYLGAWSINHDTDPTRRKMYGRAGACRYKPYGVEYRVLGNFWVLDKKMRQPVWDRMIQAIDDMRRLHIPERANADWNNRLVRSINATAHDSFLRENLNFPIATLETRYSCF